MQFSLTLQLITENNGKQAVPILVFDLLQGVRDHGNLTVAAKHADVSYRKAWNLIGHWSTTLGTPLLDATKGRGAKLTPLGSTLLWVKDHLDTQGLASVDSVLTEVRSELKKVLPDDQTDGISVCASHCICLDILQNLYQGVAAKPFSVALHGSQTSLVKLCSGESQLAGFHIAEGELAGRYLEVYGESIDLEGITAVFSHQRQQGLVVAQGNPLAVKGVEDLVKPTVRMVNRQEGSGTRVLLDLLLANSGIHAQVLDGYENVERTHTAVCARIANQQADVAVGSQAAAAQYGLGFVPLIRENYYFGYRSQESRSDDIERLVSLLRSQAWKRALEQIPGMSVDGAGTVYHRVSAVVE